MSFNVATWFVDRNAAGERAASTAFHFEDRVLTYGDVLDLTNRTGNALLELGVERGDRILVLALDAPEFLGAFWGAIKIGAIPVPVSTFLRAQDYLHFFEDSRAKVAIVSAPLLVRVEQALRQARSLEHVLVAGGNPGPYHSYEHRVAVSAGSLEAAPTSRDDAAFCLYSSGSTGAPKAAVHAHHAMVACHENYSRQILELSPADKVYSASKLFFAYGLGNAGYFPMAVGAQSVLDPHRPTEERLFENLERHRPTVFFAVPTLYARMLAVKDAARRFDLSSLRLCISAGEALPGAIYRRWRDTFNVELLDGIGTTEMLHIFISNRPGSVKPGSAGIPVPGYEALIVDDSDQPVSRGVVGNLLVAGDSAMKCYWSQNEKRNEARMGRWLQTGDKFYQDDDGYFWHVGRTDDMLKVAGLWVSPIDVEGAILEHPAVLEAAVVGTEDKEGLIKPHAFVVLKRLTTPAVAMADEILAFVRQRIASYKCPHWIDFVPELPKTGTGKLQRFKLRG